MYELNRNPHEDLPVFLTYKEVSEATKSGKSTIQQWIQEGSFPKPKYLGRKAVFLQTDVLLWIKENIRNEYSAA